MLYTRPPSAVQQSPLVLCCASSAGVTLKIPGWSTPRRFLPEFRSAAQSMAEWPGCRETLARRIGVARATAAAEVEDEDEDEEYCIRDLGGFIVESGGFKPPLLVCCCDGSRRVELFEEEEETSNRGEDDGTGGRLFTKVEVVEGFPVARWIELRDGNIVETGEPSSSLSLLWIEDFVSRGMRGSLSSFDDLVGTLKIS